MTVHVGTDTAKTRRTLQVQGKDYAYYSIPAAEAAGLGGFARLPASLKVVLENMLRFEDGKTVTVEDIRAFSDWAVRGGRSSRVGSFGPAGGAPDPSGHRLRRRFRCSRAFEGGQGARTAP